MLNIIYIIVIHFHIQDTESVLSEFFVLVNSRHVLYAYMLLAC